MTDPVRRLANRVMLLLARGLVTAVNDSAKMQVLSIALLADESKDGVERFQDYGLTSVPPVGLEALVGFIGGNRSHGIVLAVGDRTYRLRGLESGEVALYDDLGQKVHLTRNGIEIMSAKKVTVTAPEMLLDGAVHVTGTVTVDNDVVASGISLTTHTHSGVEPGAGASGGPN